MSPQALENRFYIETTPEKQEKHSPCEKMRKRLKGAANSPESLRIQGVSPIDQNIHAHEARPR